jgi:hypothetical protein
VKLDDQGAKIDRLLAEKDKSSGRQKNRSKIQDHMDEASIDRRRFKIDTSALIGEGGFAKVFAGEYLGEVRVGAPPFPCSPVNRPPGALTRAVLSPAQ